MGTSDFVQLVSVYVQVLFLFLSNADFENLYDLLGISRDSMHKRRATGGKKKAWRKKRK